MIRENLLHWFYDALDHISLSWEKETPTQREGGGLPKTESTALELQPNFKRAIQR